MTSALAQFFAFFTNLFSAANRVAVPADNAASVLETKSEVYKTHALAELNDALQVLNTK